MTRSFRTKNEEIVTIYGNRCARAQKHALLIGKLLKKMEKDPGRVIPIGARYLPESTSKDERGSCFWSDLFPTFVSVKTAVAASNGSLLFRSRERK
jgi:hypothetical protein